jgi:hypothetical protein
MRMLLTKLCLTLLSIFLLATISGCARDVYEYANDARLEHLELTGRIEQENGLVSNDGSLMTADSISLITPFNNYLKYKYDKYIYGSGDFAVLKVWMEVKRQNPSDILPLYRYVIVPVKVAGVSDIISLADDYYITANGRFPATMIKENMNGAIYTDWQFCLGCVGPDSIDKVLPNSVRYIKDAVYRYLSRDLHEGKKLNQIKFISKSEYSASSRFNGMLVSGEEAFTTSLQFENKVKDLLEDVERLSLYDREYVNFIKKLYYPMTFDAWASNKGCDLRYNSLTWVDTNEGNARSVIADNQRFIDCHSQALDSFDLQAYANEYPSLKKRAQVLWENSNRIPDNLVYLITPQEMVDNAVNQMKKALKEINDAYEHLADVANWRRTYAQNEAFVNKNWQNTFDSLRSRNNQILKSIATTDQIVRKSNYLDKIGTNKNKSLRGDSDSVKDKNISNSETKINNDKNHNLEPIKEIAGKDSVVSSGNSKNTHDNTSKLNNPVDAGRDYRVIGTTDMYHSYDIAVDLAKTAARNNASEFCGHETFKVKLTWPQVPNCKKNTREDSYLCSYEVLATCYEQRCDQDFCGTRNP